MKKLLIAIIVLGSFSSCSNYYKAVLASQPASAAGMNDLKAKNRYFIMRNGSEAFAMNAVSVSADQKNLQCNLEPLPYQHKLHQGGEGNKRYKKSVQKDEDQSDVLNEVHIYITPDSNIVSGPYTLALDKVKKTEVIEVDKTRTKRSHTLGLVLGIALPVVVVGGIIVIAISSSLAHATYL